MNLQLPLVWNFRILPPESVHPLSDQPQQLLDLHFRELSIDTEQHRAIAVEQHDVAAVVRQVPTSPPAIWLSRT
jgi:hypothetical protein